MRKRLLALAIGLSVPWFAAPAAAKPAGAVVESGRSTTPGSRTTSAKSAAATKSKASGSAKKTALASKTKRREPPPCFAKPVRFTRQRGSELEQRTFSLSYCDGRPNPAALDELSLIARSRDVDAPSAAELRAYAERPLDRGPKSKRRDPMFVTERVLRLHPDLLVRLQQIANHFPGRTIDIVSGHRPDARSTSRHHHGRALDLRVDGVSRERLRDFARTLEASGVGYYPNSVFVHVDIRDEKGYWVDRSGPGEPADYGTWPPSPREHEHTRQQLLTGALAELSALGDLSLLERRRQDDAAPPSTLGRRLPAHELVSGSPVRTLARPRAPVQSARVESARRARPADDEGGRPLSAAEVARIRADALKALAALR